MEIILMAATCCGTVTITLGRYSPAYFRLRSYLGVYRYVGEIHGAPYYRMQVKAQIQITRHAFTN